MHTRSASPMVLVGQSVAREKNARFVKIQLSLILDPPAPPTSMLGCVVASAKTKTSVFFSTATCPTTSGVNIELGGAGGTYLSISSRMTRAFFSLATGKENYFCEDATHGLLM